MSHEIPGKLINELSCIKFRINNYLDKTNFQNEELIATSENLQNFLDEYEYRHMSLRDRSAKDATDCLCDALKMIHKLVN